MVHSSHPNKLPLITYCVEAMFLKILNKAKAKLHCHISQASEVR